MQTTTAKVMTANASSYLRKLCRHWSHRFAVTFNDHHGTIELPQAACTLDAHPSYLAVQLDMPEGADEGRLRQVIEEHLQRFALKETLVFTWNPASV